MYVYIYSLRVTILCNLKDPIVSPIDTRCMYSWPISPILLKKCTMSEDQRLGSAPSSISCAVRCKSLDLRTAD